MKKLILVTIAAFALLFAMVGIASANGGPHGGYTATTDACAGCHRAHTASGAKLLVASDTTSLCMTCHDSSATGSILNVSDGVKEATAGSNAGTDLMGGGFTNYKGAQVTSSHEVTSTATALAWGNSSGRGSTAALSGNASLNCASCHDPHGSSNYRIIKETINGVSGVSVSTVDEGSQAYDAEVWGTGQSNVCAACHSDYHITAAGSGSDVTGLSASGGTAHRIGMPWDGATDSPSYVGMGTDNPETTGVISGTTTYKLPLASSNATLSNTTNTVECQTCHLPHGTSAAMSTLATGPNTSDSALLRLDNRGVCEVCHQK